MKGISILRWGFVLLDETHNVHFHIGKSMNDGRMIGHIDEKIAKFWWTDPDDFNTFEGRSLFPIGYEFIGSRMNEISGLIGVLVPLSFSADGDNIIHIPHEIAKNTGRDLLCRKNITNASAEETMITKYAIHVPVGIEICKHINDTVDIIMEPELETKVFLKCEGTGDGYVFGGIDLTVCVHVYIRRLKNMFNGVQFFSTIGTITYVVVEGLEMEDFYARARVDRTACQDRRFLLQGNSIAFDKIDFQNRAVGKALTDNIIHSAILNMPSIKYAPQDGDLSRPFFVFSSFFMSKLRHGITDRMCLFEKIKHNYQTYLKDWATVRNRSGDRVSILLDREFIFIPYNYNNIHWMLYVVYMPFAKFEAHADAPSGKYNGSRNSQVPYLFVLDSKPDLLPRNEAVRLHNLNLECLKIYFSMIFESIYGPVEARDQRIYPSIDNAKKNDDSVRGVVQCLVPHQTDVSSCGVYMLFFLAYMTKSASVRTNVVERAISGNRVFSGLLPDIVVEFRKRIVSNVTTSNNS